MTYLCLTVSVSTVVSDCDVTLFVMLLLLLLLVTGQSRAVQEQQADAPAAELARWQLQGAHVRQRLASRRLRIGNTQLAALRYQGQFSRCALLPRSVQSLLKALPPVFYYALRHDLC